jgi:hypothetical protein
MLVFFILFLAPIIARAVVYAIGNDPRSWRNADWSSIGILPAAADFAPARIHRHGRCLEGRFLRA